MTLRSINCTTCGAGLSVLGGGRVQAQVCGYCGSVLDAQDNFAVLKRHDALPRPASPFAPGMEGVIDGVQFTVIGTLGIEETHEGQRWDWVEHQLFSPTHGYCWLAVENGHVTFTRKVRGLGATGWYTPEAIETLENRPVTWWHGERFTYYESGVARIGFAEGSFNWIPKRGDETRYVSFLGKAAMLTMAESGGEREMELTRYLTPAEVASGFALKDPPRPVGVHPTQPYRPWPHGAFTRNLGLATAATALLLYGIQSSQGTTVARATLLPAGAEKVAVLPFALTRPGDLVEIEVSADVNNSWAWFDIEVVDAEGETWAEFGRETSYYHGTEGGESWSEGSSRASARIFLPEAGDYSLQIALSETAADWPGGRPARSFDVTVTEGIKAAWWLLVAAALSGAAGLVFPALRHLHNARRKSGSDWEDDDD